MLCLHLVAVLYVQTRRKTLWYPSPLSTKRKWKCYFPFSNCSRIALKGWNSVLELICWIFRLPWIPPAILNGISYASNYFWDQILSAVMNAGNMWLSFAFIHRLRWQYCRHQSTRRLLIAKIICCYNFSDFRSQYILFCSFLRYVSLYVIKL